MSNPVRHRLAAMSAAVCAVLLAFTVASCGSQPASPTAPAVNTGDTDAKGGSTQQCGPGGIKDEKAPFAATAPEGEIVTGVCVKAGMQTIPLSSSDACYDVTGIGTASATVVKVGTSSSCKDISYATFYTASPTPTPTPTNTPTSTPTNTPTALATPTPTNTPTDTPTPSPTNTPTNTPTDTPTPTPTNTPTNTPTPTPTNTPTPASGAS
jgi:hypothetical protein